MEDTQLEGRINKLEIQKRDKRPVQAGEQTCLGTPSEISCAQHPGGRRAESRW